LPAKVFGPSLFFFFRFSSKFFGAPLDRLDRQLGKTLSYSQIAQAQPFDALQRWEIADFLVRTNSPDSF
jgi:hypothetical protein